MRMPFPMESGTLVKGDHYYDQPTGMYFCTVILPWWLLATVLSAFPCAALIRTTLVRRYYRRHCHLRFLRPSSSRRKRG